MTSLRMIFGAKKISKKTFKESAKINTSVVYKDCMRGLSPILTQGVTIHPIGIKEDVEGEIEGFKQEML